MNRNRTNATVKVCWTVVVFHEMKQQMKQQLERAERAAAADAADAADVQKNLKKRKFTYCCDINDIQYKKQNQRQ